MITNGNEKKIIVIIFVSHPISKIVKSIILLLIIMQNIDSLT